MQNFDTIEQFLKTRGICPLCKSKLFPVGFAILPDKIQKKVSHKGDTYIYDISLRSKRISYSCPIDCAIDSNYHQHDLNNIILTFSCTKEIQNCREYHLTLNISTDGKPSSTISDLKISTEHYHIQFMNRMFLVCFEHDRKTATISSTGNKKLKQEYILYNLKYENIKEKDFLNQDYIKNKIENYLLLK